MPGCRQDTPNTGDGILTNGNILLEERLDLLDFLDNMRAEALDAKGTTAPEVGAEAGWTQATVGGVARWVRGGSANASLCAADPAAVVGSGSGTGAGSDSGKPSSGAAKASRRDAPSLSDAGVICVRFSGAGGGGAAFSSARIGGLAGGLRVFFFAPGHAG